MKSIIIKTVLLLLLLMLPFAIASCGEGEEEETDTEAVITYETYSEEGWSPVWRP